MPGTLDWARVDDFPELNENLKELMVTLRRFSPTALLEFFQDNVAANQSSVSLSPGLGAVLDIVMPRAGHVIGVAVYTNDSRTAGTLNVFPSIDGTDLTESAQLDATNTDSHTTKVPRDLNSAFLAGSRVGASITTDASWAPTTADIIATVLVQFSMED